MAQSQPQTTEELAATRQDPVAILQFHELWRYKLLVPAVTVLVAGAVFFWVSRQPKIYEAVATVAYDPHPAQPLGTAVEDTNESSSGYWDSQEFYATQNYVLKSRALAERVVRRLSLETDADFLGLPVDGESVAQKARVEEAAAVLQDHLEVEHVRDTRVVRLHVRDRNPDRAQLIANTIVDSYIAMSLEERLGASSQALEWLRGQMQNLKRELEASELALHKFRADNNSLSSSLAERQRLIANQLERYTHALTEIRTRRIEAEARFAVLREELSKTNELVSVHVGPLGTDPALISLRDHYRDRQQELERLMVSYGNAHPLVKAASGAVESAREQIERQVTAILRGLEIDVEELRRAESGIARALEEVNREGLELSLREIEYSKLDRERASKAELYGIVLNRATQTDLTRALRVASARLIDRAVKPEVPVSPKVRLAVAIGILLGLGMGIGAAFGAARLDNKVRGTTDLESRGVTVLGVIPGIEGMTGTNARRAHRAGARSENPERDLIVHLQPRSTVAECCRTIRTNITFQSAERPLKVVGVTSAMPQDGKTTVSISLAITLAQGGRRVLLIDTDLRKPRLHRAFRVGVQDGITSILVGESTLAQTAQATTVPNLWLVQCGALPPNPSELLHTQRFSQLIEEAKTLYDIVLLDSPPLGAVTDPAIIATQVDGTILVARSRSTRRSNVDAALRQLHSVSARVIGAVINDVDLTESSYGSYYSYYRGYYSDDDAQGGGAPPPLAVSS